MTPLIVASGVIGGIGGLIANQQRLESAEKNKKYLRDQEKLLFRSQEVGRSLLSIRASSQAISNTQGSRRQALESSSQIGKAKAALGVSGSTAGTPFYSLLSGIEENRKTLNESSQLGDLAMRQIAMSGIQQGISFEGQRLEIERQFETVDDELDYLSSPLAAVMAIGSGAISGASVGAGLQEISDKHSGVPENSSSYNYSPSYSSKALNVNTDIFGTDALPRVNTLDALNKLNSRDMLALEYWS